ncbi:lipid A-modifier LpxR family protein [Planktotalea arctica]|uniref:lipid A-modifier LpxR family protein n=1 Tax=Planktotalea arctica TaxID=1481893 RepID=UPI00321AF48D
MNRFQSALKAAILGSIFAMPLPLSAQDIVQLGYGRLINNDFLGDLKDRGQTGSYVSSRIYGKAWAARLPAHAGEILEFRLQADIKSPDNLVVPAAGDRPFAGSVSAGLHTHYQQAGYEIAMGAELVATGPQTRLDQLQTALHDGLGVSPPSGATRSAQIGDKIHPGVIVEMGRPFRLGARSQVRPFFEARAGVETLVRAGMDFEIGKSGGSDVMVRDGITGQRYRTILLGEGGVSFIVGADTAIVSQSAYLPLNRGFALTDRRDRARAGVYWQGKNSHGFFGVTYLGREYTTQASEQVVGSIRLALKF